ncbi:hypothetical protein [Nocardiopsis tropica]|uniref:Uncharacterized protein n=1 Tax=Nocardiopsis tropica TaxID=109330 RepID=A0ABU7KQV9_9ACTN|nr:hypothetical protein [Nocardiopsis umidischolae]MEE2051684.1 hypothetical protein [Nocardiopsis umidischolae]
MLETIALAPPRLGRTDVNAHLDDVLGQVGWLTTEQLGRRLEADGIVGWRDSARWHPVGLWVVGALQARGVDAVSYSWVGSFLVFGPGRVVIGEAKVAESHTLYGLECEINDGGWGELIRQGEGDER